MKLTVEIPEVFTAAQLAELFCQLNDEQQADFFIACAKYAREKWDGPQSMQWFSVGAHLRTCACSTFEARQMVSDLHSGLAEEAAVDAAQVNG